MSQPVSVETLLVGDVVGCSGGDGTRAIAKVVSVKNGWLSAEVLRCDGCREKCGHAGQSVGCTVPNIGMGGIYFWRVPDYVDRYGTPPWDPAPAWLDAPDGPGWFWLDQATPFTGDDGLKIRDVYPVLVEEMKGARPGLLFAAAAPVSAIVGKWQRVAPPREG